MLPRHLSLHKLFVLLLLFTTARGDNPGRVRATFNGDNFTNMVFSPKTQDLYLGDLNRVVQLKSASLAKISELKTGPVNDHKYCDFTSRTETQCQNSCNVLAISEKDCQRRKRNTIVRGMTLDKEYLYVCYNVRIGFCQRINLADVGNVVSNSSHPVVCADESSHVTMLLGQAPGRGVGERKALYMGVTKCDNALGRIHFNDVLTLTTRRLTNFELVRKLDPLLSHWDQSETARDIRGNYKDYFQILFRYSFNYLQPNPGLTHSTPFAYHLVVQPEDTSSQVWLTRLGRICQEDFSYTSYMELTLRCIGSDEHGQMIDYNVAESAYLGRAGSKLAQSLGIGVEDDVLYVAFRSCKPNQGLGKHTGKSAVCAYSMRQIQETYLRILRNCLLKGNMNIGPRHYKDRTECNRLHSEEERRKVTIGYCYSSDRENSPLTGSGKAESVQNYALVQFADAEVTSIRGRAASKAYTIVQLGMSDGRFMQYEVSSNGKDQPHPRQVDALQLGSSPIIRLENSSEPDFIFAMSPKQVSKIRLYDCSQYRTCGECQAAAQPYCGWCILRSACTTLKQCHEDNNWIPYDRGLACPKVERLQPPGYQIHSTEPNEQLTLKMQLANVPIRLLEQVTSPIASQHELRCCFSLGDPSLSRAWNASSRRLSEACGANIFAFTQVTVHKRNDPYQVSCRTPKIGCLPNIASGSDHVSVRVSLIVQDKAPRDPADYADPKKERRRAVMLSSEFFVFDCSRYRSCTACVTSRFSCHWCVLKNECRAQTMSKIECEPTAIVKHNKSVECPRFEHKRAVILRAAGQKRARFRVQVRPQFDSLLFKNNDFRCHLNCSRRMFETKARKVMDKSALACVFERLDYPQAVGRQRCKLDIQWHWNRRETFSLENVKNVSVELFKCEHLVGSCGECLLDLSASYKCGWCISKQQCSLAKQCPRTKWQNRTEICKDPQITMVEPLNATMVGEVTVTLRGRNLGRTFSDINGGVVLRLDPGVQTVPCRALKEFYRPGKEIRCRVEWSNWKREARGHFEVKVAREYKSRSSQEFSFLEPRVDAVRPQFGPRSGGTHVCLTGRNLAIGGRRRVHWHFPDRSRAGLACHIYRTSNVQICCSTSNATRTGKVILKLEFDGNVVKQSDQSFSYESDPTVLEVKRKSLIKSGGLSVKVLGSNLNVAASAKLVLQRGNLNATGPCVCSHPQEMNCSAPNLQDLFPDRFRRAAPTALASSPGGTELGRVTVGFQMDSVPGLLKLHNVTVYPDPEIYKFEGGEMVLPLDKTNAQRREHMVTINGKNLGRAISIADVTVQTDTAQCAVLKLLENEIICLLEQPSSDVSQDVVVKIGQLLTFNVGKLVYKSSQTFSIDMIYIIGPGVLFVVCIIPLCALLIRHRQKKQRTKMKQEMVREYMELESMVANECKEAFAELQMAMSEVTHALALASPNGQRCLPFRDYRFFCLKHLFPHQEHSTLPVVNQLEIPRERFTEFDTGFKKLSELLKNRVFMLITIRTLEAQPSFNAREIGNFTSLLSAALQSKMEYFTEMLKVLLVEFISHTVEKHKERVLFRRHESVAEKMLSNWLVFLLYDYLQDRAGEPLYLLTQAISLQISSGPVDAITHQSRYTLNDNNLIQESVSCSEVRLIMIDPQCLFEECHNNEPDWEQAVKVLDVDTITQVKEKILFVIYRHTAYSMRTQADEVDLELAEPINGHPEKVQLTEVARVMQDMDNTSEIEQRGNRSAWRKLNTLKHYIRLWGFKTPAYVKLTFKAARCDTNSFKGGEYPSSLVNSTSNLIGAVGDPERFDGMHSLTTGTTGNTALSSVSIGGTLPHSIAPSASYKQFPLSQRTLTDDVRSYHLTRPKEDQREDIGRATMTVEAQLNRMAFTKQCIKRYIEDFLRTVFAVSLDSATGSEPVVPLCIKYIFDFLDDQARNHSLTDLEAHKWKSYCLPQRFWVNVVQNPEFLFDLNKTESVFSSLDIVAQTLMESCSWQRTELTPDSPTTKLLFGPETEKFRELVHAYYKDIKSIPAISEQDMSVYLIAHSTKHANDFDVTNAFYNLYLQYISVYYKQIYEALEMDESARQLRLGSLLAEVQHYLGNTKC